MRNTLYNNASKHIEQGRAKSLCKSDQSRPDLFITGFEEDTYERFKGDFGKRVLTEWLGAPLKYGKTDRDKKFMKKFLECSDMSKLPMIPTIDLVSFLPGGAPLIQYLRVEALMGQSHYQYPSSVYLEFLANRCSLDYDTLSGVDVREFTLGKDPMDEIELISEWIEQNIREDQRSFPAEFLSCDVEEIKIPRCRYEELKKVNRNWAHDPRPLVFKVPSFYDKECVNLPARIILGNGYTWMASIRFNFDLVQDEKGILYYSLSPSPIPEEALRVLRSPTILTGLGVINDRNGLEDVLYQVFNIEVRLTRCVEIDAIAVAAGWKLPKSNMFTTNLITMGGLMNKEVSCADQKWCLEWNDLPDEFKIYCIGDVKFGYSNYIVLMSALMRNIIPDLDVFCYTFQLSQPAAIALFAFAVGCELGEKNINPSLRSEAETRVDLVNCLRGWRSSGNGRVMERESSGRVRQFARLIPDWSSVVHGGARDLHAVRSYFAAVQFEVFMDIFKYVNHGTISPNLTRRMDDEFLMDITFKRGIIESEVIPGIARRGLGSPSVPEDKIFQLNANHITTMDIWNMVEQTGQSPKAGILEAVRLHPFLIQHLAGRLNSLDLSRPIFSFWQDNLSLYQRLKQMQRILLDPLPPQGIIVHQLEEEILSRESRVTALELEAKSRDELKLKKREERIELFQTLSATEDYQSESRSGLQQRVYAQVPGDNLARNRKMRESKKKKYKKVQEKYDYFPKQMWKILGKHNMRPIRVSGHNAKAKGRDLRDVIECKQKAVAIPQTPKEEKREKHGSEATQVSERCTQGEELLKQRYTTYKRELPKELIEDRCFVTNKYGDEHQGPSHKYSRQEEDCSEITEDEITNDFVTGAMMRAGYYPKKGKEGFARFKS